MIMAESTDDPGGEEAAGGVTARQREHSPMLHLDLYNFECNEAEGSRYVLTSPRSLEACARCMVKPVELLSRSLADLVREAPGRSMRVAKGLCEVYEIERQRKLQMCREERERIIRQEKRRILPLMMSSSLGPPSSSKAPSRAEPHSSTAAQNSDLPKSVGQQNNEPSTKSQTQKNTNLSKGFQKTNQPPLKGPHKHRSKVSTSLQRSESLICNDVQNRGPTVSKKPICPAPPKHKSQSLDSLQKARGGASAKTSSESTTSSCSGDGRAVQFIQRSRTLDTVNSLMGRSFSLGDLSHSPQTAKKVEKMVKEVKKRGVQELPQRDKKIAAIMIAKHQEENIRKEQRYLAHIQWDIQRKNSELRKEQEEKERQKALLHGQRSWERHMKSRENRNSVGEMSTASLTQSKSPLLEEKGKDQVQELEKIKGEKLANTQTVKQKKSKEEKKEQEGGLFQDKLLVAQHKKKENEEQLHISKSLQNKAEKMKHQAMAQELTQKKEYETEELRKTLQKNLQKAQENVEQLLEKRNQELKERARKEELQILRAKQAAEKQEQGRQEHLQKLAIVAEKRLQHAAQVAEEVVQHKARKAIECRLEKERIQRENRQRVQKNEDMKRKELLESIEKKLERSDHIFRERQTVLDNARSVARASFNIREKVRAETNTRTFDKMAFEAELYANINKK
ncbi:coiled-coil domain-containing protein 177 [Xenopus tropicalis]|uniref:Coiled-coil domain containing 177 n=1 Tax=Xenopus tropicalis TaxID=8364 RepID=A0A803K2Q6_XENTR|nr:coiled-coil domain-containing protein 177 [Xenopus tropicalis]|eukprot:XP_002935376.2 PREDICTED: coiled-coil domain-containing protein 177 [Xenopus tropicalis]